MDQRRRSIRDRLQRTVGELQDVERARLRPQHALRDLERELLREVQRAAFTQQEQRTIGREGERPGEFRHPVGVSVREDALFVSELTGRRIQALTFDGTPLLTLRSPVRT